MSGHLINVDVADAVGVAHDRNLGVLLDVADLREHPIQSFSGQETTGLLSVHLLSVDGAATCAHVKVGAACLRWKCAIRSGAKALQQPIGGRDEIAAIIASQHNWRSIITGRAAGWQ